MFDGKQKLFYFLLLSGSFGVKSTH